MGIFGALTTSVAGLRAQSYALENISGNIANSQTTGFKRIDTSFMDLVPGTGTNNQLAGSVTTQSRETNTVRGDVQSAAVSTYMAINGDGFFVVQKPASFTDNQPVFSGVDMYTRRGDFTLDKNGYLVNGAGYYVEGVPIDPTTGNQTGSVPQVLKFANDFLPAVATSTVNYRANLASYPLTTKHDTSVPGSELLRPADFAAGNPRIVGTPATPFVDATTTGGAKNNKAATPVPITAATTLSGAANTDSIGTNFGAGDTITVNGTVITFVASGATGNQLNVTDSVGTLLAKIDSITGTTAPSTISGGAITLHSGTASDLTVTSSNATAFAALGFGTTATALRTGGGTAGTGKVLATDQQAFINESISGGAVTAYDVSGSPVSLQMRWAKVDSASLGTGHTDTWNLFYQVNPNATGTDVAWQNVNTDFQFSPNGQMSPSVAGITLNNPTVGGVPLGKIALNFGSGGVTQFADANGNVKVNQIQQDGFPAGSLQTVSIGDNGRVIGNYSNGRNIDLAQISVATFNGTNFLKRIDGGAFQATDQSGQALFGSGGTIQGSSLESSNTDIADEFTKLIVTQQAYSANTKVITTSNTMVQDLLNVLR
ncbi:flagellar hook-basal body complex protein [Bradyrhizobium sp. U87765 SZCCT0131]|uniref:flagellar hook-basal body complex protein n=1 Tax=unclassified Bradyrhizobium TaxID=2631580 RepID=UPI001BA84E3F|nr:MULTISPECIES: flagellar hook-basal body complex protein [unclassified Bradyrhizobium]MBR1219738.1 flagellar hook-basal body complex protein [Bradyrhizobium sp. U87765 SZCCT0131]MBR1262389.1 flagellar hook-basal body complex protein [Bradyrhizobium sp. U87765 SZCCT0134]MBR1308428.1 flagellar hook-basal body complex protein [Bradyrhizobium sp. U87765 SZCCT0110]MBR1318171.1 flagellar hook-basal body complex protein [Bradyrhizobium sp. U87765 SZCCT0109]MBR1351874.1 flagellar hook-basal body com